MAYASAADYSSTVVYPVKGVGPEGEIAGLTSICQGPWGMLLRKCGVGLGTRSLIGAACDELSRNATTEAGIAGALEVLSDDVALHPRSRLPFSGNVMVVGYAPGEFERTLRRSPNYAPEGYLTTQRARLKTAVEGSGTAVLRNTVVMLSEPSESNEDKNNQPDILHIGLEGLQIPLLHAPGYDTEQLDGPAKLACAVYNYVNMSPSEIVGRVVDHHNNQSDI